MKITDLKSIILEAYEDVLIEAASELPIGKVKNIEIFVNDQSSVTDTMFYRLVDTKSGKEFEVSVDVAGEEVDLNYVKEENPILAKIGFPHGDAIGNYIVKDINKELDLDEAEVNEAPDNMYYIKVPRRDKAQQNAVQNVIETFYSPVRFADIVDDDGAGNVIMYIRKEDFDEGMVDDLAGEGVDVESQTNFPVLDELNESLVEKLDEADEDEEAPEDKGKAPEKEEEELEPENDAVLEDATDTIFRSFQH